MPRRCRHNLRGEAHWRTPRAIPNRWRVQTLHMYWSWHEEVFWAEPSICIYAGVGGRYLLGSVLAAFAAARAKAMTLGGYRDNPSGWILGLRLGMAAIEFQRVPRLDGDRRVRLRTSEHLF
jgi:hypothetical protein